VTLLAAIENPVLTMMYVNCPGSDVEQFVETIPTITETTGRGLHDCLEEFMVESPDKFKITPQIIARSSSFKNLTRLQLLSACSDVCQTSDLTDDDIDLLTRAMPCLKELSIGGHPCGIPSRITFKSLYIISSRCRQLRYLRVHFNPALFVTKVCAELQTWDIALGLSDLNTLSSDALCSVSAFFVGKIPLPAQPNASSVMALALMKIFPYLEVIHYVFQNDDWGNVNHLIDVCRNMGRFALGKR
jgi:hypothetical protein